MPAATATTTTATGWTPTRVDGPLTTTFIPDDSCFEMHYLQVEDDEDDIVSFMPYDAYHPADPDIIPTCDSRATRASCYPPGDWDAPTFSPGLHCPEGWTTASVSRPYLTWCCPNGLEFDHDTTQPWCSFPAQSSSRIVMTVDCTPTTFDIGPEETTSLTLVGYGADQSPYVVAASALVLDGGAVGIALVGNASSTELGMAGGSPVVVSLPSSETTSGGLLTAAATSSDPTGDTLPPSTSTPNNSAKIGGAVGGTVGALLLVALGFVFFRRYRNRRLNGRSHPAGGHSSKVDELDGNPIVHELGAKSPAIELSGKSSAVELSGGDSTPPSVHEAPSARVYEMP